MVEHNLHATCCDRKFNYIGTVQILISGQFITTRQSAISSPQSKDVSLYPVSSTFTIDHFQYFQPNTTKISTNLQEFLPT